MALLHILMWNWHQALWSWQILQQPAGVLHHLTGVYIIRTTAQQTTHSHRSASDHIIYLSQNLATAGKHALRLANGCSFSYNEKTNSN